MKKRLCALLCAALLLLGAGALADTAPCNMKVPPEAIATQPVGTLDTYGLTFPEDMPLAARNFVLFAREQFEKHPFEKPSPNEYMKWYYHEERDVGWCSVFQIYCAYHSGLQLVRYKQDVEIGPGDVFSTMEGRVGNVYYAFEEHGRWLDAAQGAVPKPGYLVIYGVIGSSGFWHIAIVESVKEIGDGVYELTTVEGNLGSRIKRLNYRYDATPDKPNDNFSVVPEGEITQLNCQYTLPSANSGKKWYINGFCATW